MLVPLNARWVQSDFSAGKQRVLRRSTQGTGEPATRAEIAFRFPARTSVRRGTDQADLVSVL